MLETNAPGRLIPVDEVIDKIGTSKTTIYDDVKKGLFPAPIPIGANRVRWVEAEVDAWIQAKIAAARGRAA